MVTWSSGRVKDSQSNECEDQSDSESQGGLPVFSTEPGAERLSIIVGEYPESGSRDDQEEPYQRFPPFQPRSAFPSRFLGDNLRLLD